MRRYEFISWRTTRSRVLSVAAVALATVARLAAPSHAGTVTFGSGAGNTFAMEFVTIGNPNNTADTNANPSPAGRVTYAYDIGKFEVSRDMVTKYNANFGTTNNLEITLLDMDDFGIVGGNGANKPATGVSWNEAARFVNWLNVNQGFAKAYKFADGSAVNDNIQLWQSGEAGYDVNNKYRNSLAKYFLPSYNEWYKAAYYNPNDSTYYDYANGSITAPTAVASGTGDNTAVYGQQQAQGPADVTSAGGLSPYGVMGLGGNVWEWEESSLDLLNDDFTSDRALRGGSWYGNSSNLSSSIRGLDLPSAEYNDSGFRVASLSSSSAAAVPEPGTLLLGTLLGLGGYLGKRRMKK